jgi:Tfp pilus assembly protein PilV
MRIARNDGFSIVEVLIATALFVTAVASLVQLFSLSLGANLAARYRTEAAILASAKVEELLAVPWGTETTDADDARGFTRVWAVTPLPDHPDTARAIDVRVGRARFDAVRMLAVKVRQVR